MMCVRSNLVNEHKKELVPTDLEVAVSDGDGTPADKEMLFLLVFEKVFYWTITSAIHIC